MNTGTGTLITADYFAKLKAEQNPIANLYKEVPQFLTEMNRKQRREWYRKNKKLLRKEA